ncbi:hypothetical protein ABFS82_10G098500 [Erythranthe guttata]
MIAIRHFGGPMSFFLLCFSLHRREHFLSHLSLTPRPPLSKLYILHHDSPHADLERRSTRSRRFRRRQPSTLHLLPPTGQLRHRPEIALAHSPLDLHLQEQTNLFELMLPLSIIEMEVRRMNGCRDLFRLGFYCWCCCVGFGLQFFEFLQWRHPSNTSRALFFQLHILLLPFSPAAAFSSY